MICVTRTNTHGRTLTLPRVAAPSRDAATTSKTSDGTGGTTVERDTTHPGAESHGLTKPTA